MNEEKKCLKHGALSENHISKENRRKGWTCKICKDQSRIKDWGDSLTLICSVCKKEKIKSEYTKDEQKSCSPRCRGCRCKYRKSFRSLNKEHVNEQNKEYKSKHSSKKKAKITSRKWFLSRHYGMSEIDYHNMSNKQNGTCAICLKPETVFDRRQGCTRNLSIDHCHLTGKIRGLLCTKCNKGLGCFNDNQDLLNVAISYLRNSN